MFHLCFGKLWILYFCQNLISVRMCDAEETQPAKPWDESHGISMTTYRSTVCYMHPYWHWLLLAFSHAELKGRLTNRLQRMLLGFKCGNWRSCFIQGKPETNGAALQKEWALHHSFPCWGCLVKKRNGHWQVSTESENSCGGPFQGSESLAKSLSVWLTSIMR